MALTSTAQSPANGDHYEHAKKEDPQGGTTASQDEHKNLPVKDGHFPLGTGTWDERER